MAVAVFPWETATSGKRRGRVVVVPPDSILPFPVAQQIRWTADGRTRGSHYEWARKCPACGRIRVFLAHQRTCSKRCGMVRASFRAGAELAFRRRLPRMIERLKEAKRRIADAKVAELAAGLTPEQAWRVAYRRGYLAGNRAKHLGHTPLDGSLRAGKAS